MILRGRLLDSDRWRAERGFLEIREGKIGRVAPDEAFQNEGECLDVGDRVIMPGLIDTHIHLWGVRTMDYFHRLVVPEEMNLLRGAQDLRRLIDAGYTAVRDCGSRGGIFLRNAVNEGTLPGPRIKTPRFNITQTGGHADKHFIPLEEAKTRRASTCRIADGPDDCRRAVREQFREGADFIKISVTGGLSGEKETPEEVQFSDEELKIIVEEANKKGGRISAHAYGLNGIRKVVQLGVQMVEHGVYLDEAVCEEMVKKNTLLTPTLNISYKFAHEGAQYGSPPWAVDKAKQVLELHVRSFQMAHRMGVRMATGTDTSGAPMLPHGKNAFELELMVNAGFSPLEAIRAATKTASEVLGIDREVGTLEAGKQADLIVVDGDPLADIRILQDNAKIKLVMKGGAILKSTLAEAVRLKP